MMLAVSWRAAERAADDASSVPASRAAPARARVGGLGAPGVVQRDVGRALDAACQVPVGLAVAHECRARSCDPSRHSSAGLATQAASRAASRRASRTRPRRSYGRAGVALGDAAVDDHDRQCGAAGLLEQADARVHDERRAGDEQRVGALHERGRRLRTSRPARTRRRRRRRASACRRTRCSRGSRTRRRRRRRRRRRARAGSPSRGRSRGSAARAASATPARAKICPQLRQTHAVHRAVQLDDRARLPARRCRPSTFCVMTPVTMPGGLEVGERAVAGVGLRAAEAAPAEVAARPVALARASRSPRNVCNVIGVRTGAPSPR